MPRSQTYASQEKLLHDLNPEQIKAVIHKTGPLLIIAGAGTGKTTVITRRIAWLIAEKLAKPYEILALTFTDKAANEMEERVDLLVPYGFVDVSILTFHAFGDRIIRDHAIELGMTLDYRVLSMAEQNIFFRDHIFEFPLKYYKSLGDPTRHIQALISLISRAKDEDISAEEYVRWGQKAMKAREGRGRRIGQKAIKANKAEGYEEIKRQLEVAEVYQKYQYLKLEKGFVDFGDQVNLALKLFRERPSILKKIREKYKYILVDEFQDTNYAQFELLKLLAGKKANITVVGDDDQSIYKFRGAAISNILNFDKVFPKAKKIVLTKNYRSTQIILDAARRVIKNNEIKLGIEKKLIAVVGQGQCKVEHKHFDRVSSEADWVAQTIKEGSYALKDIAILVRSNADAEPFRQSLNMLGIPHSFSGGGGLYSLPEIKLAIAFLRVVGDPSDSLSLYQLAVSEIYKLGPLDLQKMNIFAGRRNHTLHHVFAHLEEFELLKDIKTESRKAIHQIMQDIEYYLAFAKQRTTGEVLYKFLKKTGYLAGLTRIQDPVNEAKVKNLSQFFEKVKEFRGIVEEDRVSEFVKYLNLLKEAGEDPESAQPDIDTDAVSLMTIHKAKGLEFKVVFMVALVDGKFPVRERKEPIELPAKLVKEPLPKEDLSLMEERRLFYVGMTRAREELYLTSSVSYGGKRDRKISPFVLEAMDVPKANIKVMKKAAIGQIELFAPAEPVLPQERKRGEDEVIPLSHYQIDDYLTCPLKYKYVHILRVPLLPNHQIIYGSALHKAVQNYFTAKLKSEKFTEKQLLDSFANNWSSEGFISRAHEEQRFERGKKALKRFYQEDKKSKRKARLVEEEFTVLKDKVQVKGRIDLVEELKGKVYIIDFKSSEVEEQEKADQRVKESLQLSIYALAWKEKNRVLPDQVELNFLDTGVVGSAKRSAKDLDKAWDKIKRVAAGIRAGDYHATPNSRACSYCPYNEECPSSAV